MVRFCKICNIEKEIKSGKICNKCKSIKYKENTKKYYLDNKDNIKNKIKEYKLNNKDYIKQYNISYIKENKEKIKKNPILKINGNIRTAIYFSLKKNKFSKNLKTEEIIGCSFDEFKIYLESKFEYWMNWGNYGKYNGELNYGWDIDHIIPLSSASNEEDIIKLNHCNNLQPLCSYTNRYVKMHKY